MNNPNTNSQNTGSSLVVSDDEVLAGSGGLTGCSNHLCVIKKPKGMGTNGPCTCRPYKLGLVINRLRRMLTERDERLKLLMAEHDADCCHDMEYPHPNSDGIACGDCEWCKVEKLMTTQ